MTPDFSSIWLVFLLPLAGFLVQALVGKLVVDTLGPRLGRPLMGWLGVAPIAGAFLVGLDITVRLLQLPAQQRAHVAYGFDWITLQSLSIPVEFRVDPLSMTMVLIITGIGALIHMYSIGYMAEEREFTRFFTYLNLFVAAMLVLVLGNNLALTFVGWEGVGLCSYLLIGFWYKDHANAKAANKAFIVNRIGDWGFTLGLFGVVMLVAANKSEFGITDPRWLSFDVILPVAGRLLEAYPAWATVIALLLFVGAMGKSAQYPLAIWLPDAMAGPTPVSALIHAATMVTSGVYLLNRMGPWILASPMAMAVIALVGAATALIGAATAFGQTDIKKVLAFSTVSQLGYMFIACGVGALWAGMFHVLTHAFFKALLFLGSGAVIHAMAHEQDMRSYGALWKRLPITFWTMLVGWAAIAGIPFLFSGFWSKEAILGKAVNDGSKVVMIGSMTAGQVAGWVGFAVALMTACYMTRMMLLTFGGGSERWRTAEAHGDHAHHAHAHHADHAHDAHHEDPNGFFMTDEEVARRDQAVPDEHHHALEPDHKPHEVPWLMWVPLAVLAVFSFGWVGAQLEAGHFFRSWLEMGAHHEEKTKAIGYWTLVAISAGTGLGGILLGLALYWKGLPGSEGYDMSRWGVLRKWSRAQFGIDHVLSDRTVSASGGVGAFSWWFDRNIVDGLVNLVGWTARGLAGVFRLFQTGYVRSYALLMSLGVVSLIGYLFYVLQEAGK